MRTIVLLCSEDVVSLAGFVLFPSLFCVSLIKRGPSYQRHTNGIVHSAESNDAHQSPPSKRKEKKKSN